MHNVQFISVGGSRRQDGDGEEGGEGGGRRARYDEQGEERGATRCDIRAL